MNDAYLNELLDEFVPPFEARAGGWEDVLKRARRSRLRATTRALVLAAAVAALAALAVPAFGVVDTLREFFEGAPPTPAVEQHVAEWNELATQAPAGALLHLPSVDGSRVHGVLTLSASHHDLFLWSGPASDARECWLISIVDNQRPAEEQTAQTVNGPSGCRNVGPDKAGTSWFGQHEPGNEAGIAWTEFPNTALPGYRIVFGRVWSEVRSAKIGLDDGVTLNVPVIEHYFLALIDSDSTTSRITVYDEHGNEVGESARGNVVPRTVTVTG